MTARCGCPTSTPRPPAGGDPRRDRAATGSLGLFVQHAHPGTIRLEGDTALGRAYVSELMHGRGGSHLNYSVYHDRYRRTPDGWRFTERVYEVRYLDTTPLAGTHPEFDTRGSPRTLPETMPDDHFGPEVAARYDEDSAAMFAPEALDPAIDRLAALAGDRPALELAIGNC